MSNMMQPKSSGSPVPSNWDPFAMMREMLRTWPETGRSWPGFTTLESMRFNPDFDVKETREGYLVRADLPGVAEKDLEVTHQGNMLRVTGKREAEKEDKSDTYYTMERSYGSFTRMFTLPEAADVDRTNAELKNGVLQIFIPRRAEMKSTKVAVKNAG